MIVVVRLTRMGKIVVGLIVLIVLIVVASLVLPLFLPSEKPGQLEVFGSGKLRVKVFVSSFDPDSVKMVERLRDISKEEDLQGVFSYEIINIHKDPEKARNAGITKTPAIEVAGEKYVGLQETDWLKQKIIEKTS